MTAIKQFDSTWQREGIWYLPGRENNSFYGSLKYNLENGFELSIIGSISENVFGLIGGRYPEIWGTTVDGINITIIDAISVGSTFNAPGFPTERIAAATGLVGCHVIEHNTRVQSFTTCIDRLAKWYGKSGIKKEYSSDEIGLKIPMSNKPLLQYLGSDRSVYFSFSRDFQGLNSGQVTISEKVWYGEYLFYPKRIKDAVNENINFFSRFISFMANSKCKIRAISLNLLDVYRWEYHEGVQLWMSGSAGAPIEDMIQPQYLSSYDTLGDSYPQIYENWAFHNRYLAPVFDLYFETVIREHISIQNQ